MLTNNDEKQIEDHGLSIDEVNRQLETFSHGISFANLVTAGSIGNGIEQITSKNQQKLVNLYDRKRNGLDIVKFVPASGAATRMFSFLHEFLECFNPETQSLKDYLKGGNHLALSTFLNFQQDFAFVNAVRKQIRKHYPEYKHGTKGIRAYLFVSSMLTKKGLNLNALPKGLIPFHRYSKYSITAFEEQLNESAYYAAANEEAFVHFHFF